MNTIILLSGKKQSGKSTLTKLFVNEGFVECAFADTLKDLSLKLVKDILSGEVSKENFYDEKLKETEIRIPFATKGVTPRILLQKFGTEFIRNNISDTYWIDRLIFEKIIKNTFFNYVISDARFVNEIEYFKNRLEHMFKFITIRIQRDTGLIDTHDSEIDLDNYEKWDHIFHNNGTINDMDKFCKTILKNIRG